MWVTMVQSDDGYATHVSTKPSPIWESSRKDLQAENRVSIIARERASDKEESRRASGGELKSHTIHARMFAEKRRVRR